MESDSRRSGFWVWSWSAVLLLGAVSLRPLPGAEYLLFLPLVLALGVLALVMAADAAFAKVSRARLHKLADEGDVGAKRVQDLLSRPHRLSLTLLTVETLCLLLAAAVGTLVARDTRLGAAPPLAFLLLTLIVLLFCVLVPRAAATRNAERWSRVLVRPIAALVVLAAPLVRTLDALTRMLLRITAEDWAAEQRGSSDELRLLVESVEEQGNIEADERTMIDNVFELSERTVREVMVQRVDMVTVEASATLAEATEIILQGGQSRIPVYEETIDEIIGVLYAKDILRVLATRQAPAPLRELVRPAHFVPETKSCGALLRELRAQRVHLAVVLDEYSSVVGLVTIEDLVEEVVGEIQDEYDREEQLFEKVSENEFIVDAKLLVEDFEELIERQLPPEENYDTVGGFVYDQLAKIPTIGDTVRYHDMEITVLSTKGRRLIKLRVVRGLPVPSAEDAVGVPPGQGAHPEG